MNSLDKDIDTMKSLDKDIDTIMQILTENTSYSPQAQAYIIHGAIQKLIEWKNSFLTNTTEMQLMKIKEAPRYAELALLERKEFFIIMHAHSIWKGFFFESPEQAAGVLRDTIDTRFKTMSGRGLTVLVNEADGSRYVIQPLLQYTGMEDIQRPQA